MKHPMPRNRRRLRNRALAWKLHWTQKRESYESSYEGAVAKRLGLGNLMYGADGPQPKGILRG